MSWYSSSGSNTWEQQQLHMQGCNPEGRSYILSAQHEASQAPFAVHGRALLGGQGDEVSLAVISLNQLPDTMGELWSLLVSEGKRRRESYFQAGEEQPLEPEEEPAHTTWMLTVSLTPSVLEPGGPLPA